MALPDIGGTIQTQSPGHPPRSLTYEARVKAQLQSSSFNRMFYKVCKNSSKVSRSDFLPLSVEKQQQNSFLTELTLKQKPFGKLQGHRIETFRFDYEYEIEHVYDFSNLIYPLSDQSCFCCLLICW